MAVPEQAEPLAYHHGCVIEVTPKAGTNASEVSEVRVAPPSQAAIPLAFGCCERLIDRVKSNVPYLGQFDDGYRSIVRGGHYAHVSDSGERETARSKFDG